MVSDLSELEQMLESARIERQQLADQRDQIMKRLGEIDSMVKILRKAQNILLGRSDAASVPPLDLSPRRSTIPAALEKALRNRGGRAAIADLVTDLEKAGEIRGKDRRSRYAQAYRTMKDRPRTFEALGDGLFALKTDA
jgi:hypothetical protein